MSRNCYLLTPAFRKLLELGGLRRRRLIRPISPRDGVDTRNAPGWRAFSGTRKPAFILQLSIVLTSLFIVCFNVALFAADIAPLTEKINQLARDIHMSRKTVTGADQEARVAALTKESLSNDELKLAISQISTIKDVQNSIDTLRQFNYRISTSAEKKAFQQSIALLESRIKFLSQEDKVFLQYIDSLDGLTSENDRNKTYDDSGPGTRVERLAEKTSSTSVAETGLLGANVANGKTHFSVYSPNATELNVVLFNEAFEKNGSTYPMKKGDDGVWRCTVDGELYGKYYGYKADGPKTDGNLFDSKRLLSDPYAFSNVNHDGYSVIVKRDFTWSDQSFKTPAVKDLIVYEMHVKDYTLHESSGVSASARGKYLALLEGKGSDKVLGHLVDLGVNAIELMPCHEFDNYFAGHMNHWGYMTTHFFAPETNYASGIDGEGVKEFKQMVNGLHKAGIAVIMDVVFNHTAEGNEQGAPLCYKGLDNPGYYRLTDDKKYYYNGTGCGNEFRSDNPMTRKLILDSLKYWVREYHVDGFRFDLCTIIDKETMNAMINELPASTILIAEPWATDWKRNQWGKSDFRNTKWAKWNDDFRENIRTFVKGNGDRNNVMTVLAGSCFWWTAKPTESLNYIECHDGAVMNDVLDGNKARFKLAAVALLTAQGIPMIHEGQEFMKSKAGNDNSYDQNNEINWINWQVKRTNIDIFNYYKGLIEIRNKYDNFKHTTALNNQHINWIQPPNQKAVGYILKGTPDIMVLLNSDANEWVNFQLPDGNDWTVICNGDKADDKGLGTTHGDYNVPALTGVILKSK